MEGGKRYVITLLLEAGVFRLGANNSTNCMTHGRGTGGKLASDCALTHSHQRGRDINNDRRMMGTGSDGGRASDTANF